jgi:CTP synthase
VVGKYIELQDAYKSVYESVTHAGIANNCQVNVRRIDAEELEKPGGLGRLAAWTASSCPGGFGDRGTEGKIAAARYARENKIPYFGLCLGPADRRHRIRPKRPQASRAEQHWNSTRGPPSGDQHDGGAEEDHRQGGDHAPRAATNARSPGHPGARAYRVASVRERHRHRYEVNNAYVGQLQRAGLIVSGINPRRNLVEIVELKNHPWFLGRAIPPRVSVQAEQGPSAFRGLSSPRPSNSRGRGRKARAKRR